MPQIVRNLDHFPNDFRGGAVSVGNFDGVHLGHARIIARLIELARELSGPAIVFTFDPHPARLLSPQAAPLPLCWPERKADLLGKLGVEAVVIYPTDHHLLSLSPEEFFSRILCDRLAARGIVEGPDFRFGRGRVGNMATLEGLGRAAGVRVETLAPVEEAGQPISSSRVRSLLAMGRVEEAGRLLTEPYRIRGRVARGAGRGRGLGYPTANLVGIDTLLPAEGIYAGRVWTGREVWPAALSLGPNPTFDEVILKVEVHLIGFCGDLYDRAVEVDFLARLRDIERFGSIEQLQKEIGRDIARARQIAEQYVPGQAAAGVLDWECQRARSGQ